MEYLKTDKPQEDFWDTVTPGFGIRVTRGGTQTFMVMAIAKGLDGAIVNPLDQKMMANIVAAEALAGKDEYCGNYLEAFRAKKFEF